MFMHPCAPVFMYTIVSFQIPIYFDDCLLGLSFCFGQCMIAADEQVSVAISTYYPIEAFVPFKFQDTQLRLKLFHGRSIAHSISVGIQDQVCQCWKALHFWWPGTSRHYPGDIRGGVFHW